LRATRGTRDGLKVVELHEAGLPRSVWGRDLFMNGTRFDLPKSEADESQDRRDHYAISMTTALNLQTYSQGGTPVEKWTAWTAPGRGAPLNKLTYVDADRCERAPPQPAASTAQPVDGSQGTAEPRQSPKIEDFSAYSGHDGEFIAYAASDNGQPMALWHLALRSQQGTVEATLSCIGAMPEHGELLSFPEIFDDKVTRVLWLDDHGISVLSLTNEGEGPAQLSRPQQLGLPLNAVRSALPLADGSIAVLTAGGDLEVRIQCRSVASSRGPLYCSFA
jgi:hypothetical protein